MIPRATRERTCLGLSLVLILLEALFSKDGISPYYDNQVFSELGLSFHA